MTIMPSAETVRTHEVAFTLTCALRFFGSVTDGSNVADASAAAEAASMDVYVKSVLRNDVPGPDGRPITGVPVTVNAPPADSSPNHVPPPNATASAPGADAVPSTTPPFTSSVVTPASEAFAPEPRERKKARRERDDEKNELVELEPRDIKKERKARDLELFEEPRERRERRRVEREEELDDAREARAKRRRESDEETERIAREEEEREARIRERERAQDAVIAASQREERTLPTWDEALSYVVNFNLSRRNQRTRAK